jgi:hypothetical protein
MRQNEDERVDTFNKLFDKLMKTLAKERFSKRHPKIDPLGLGVYAEIGNKRSAPATIFMPPTVKSVMWKILLSTTKIGRFVFWLWIPPNLLDCMKPELSKT